jgi:hypothetical protein
MLVWIHFNTTTSRNRSLIGYTPLLLKSCRPVLESSLDLADRYMDGLYGARFFLVHASQATNRDQSQTDGTVYGVLLLQAHAPHLRWQFDWCKRGGSNRTIA